MQYKVLPFHPTITDKGGSNQAAKELENIIQENIKDGWGFVSLQSMTTTVKPTGCSSLFGKNEIATIQLVIFGK